VSKGSGWDKGLRVEADGRGQVGQAGIVLLRKVSDKTGLTGALRSCFPVSSAPNWVDRAASLVYLACAIALGATGLSAAERMRHHHEPLRLSGGSDSTIWRLLDGLDERAAKRVNRARAAARKVAWALIGERTQGFPWLEVAGKTLTGWVVIDMDATIVEASSAKEGAAGTFKGSFGHHPLAAWCANTLECLAMMLRPGNAGSNDAADHVTVLRQALRQLPRTSYRKLMVRIDGAGATHALLEHLQGLNHAARRVIYTVGWTITAADEQAIGTLPETAWTVAVGQNGEATPGYEIAELTGLNTRPGWPGGLRLIVRRCRPSRRQAKKLTVFEHETGFVYSIVATNIGFKGIKGVPGSHTAQFIDVLHRHHAIVEDRVRCNKAMGLRNLPSASWRVNTAWILAANLAADLDTWTRLLGCDGDPELEAAEPDTIRAKLYAVGARLACHARKRTLRLPATWPWAQAFTRAWQRLQALPDPAT
jgi:hypothetical protein